MSVQEGVGEAVGRFAETVGVQAANDPAGVGTVALSSLGAIAASGLAWWWRRRRAREGRRKVNLDIPAGERVNLTFSGGQGATDGAD